MNDASINEISESLKSMHKDDDAFRRIVSWFYDRKKDSWEMPVRIAAYRTGLDEREVRRVFKELETLGCGRFIKGRGENAESRMAWKLSIRDIASAAKGETSEIEEVGTSPEDTLEAEESKMMPTQSVENGGEAHSFRLRADFTVSINLPLDITEGEAERLSRFIKAIPLI